MHLFSNVKKICPYWNYMEHDRCIWDDRENGKLKAYIMGHCLKRTWVSHNSKTLRHLGTKA